MAYLGPIDNFNLSLANLHQRNQEREKLTEEDFEQAKLDVPTTLKTINVSIPFFTIVITAV